MIMCRTTGYTHGREPVVHVVDQDIQRQHGLPRAKAGDRGTFHTECGRSIYGVSLEGTAKDVTCKRGCGRPPS